MKLLFIDDDSYRSKTLIELLELYGYEVSFFSQYHEGFEYLQSNLKQFNVVILDILMPPGDYFDINETENGRKTGLLLYRKIREIFQGPIIIYSIINENSSINSFIKNDDNVVFIKRPSRIEVIISNLRRLTK